MRLTRSGLRHLPAVSRYAVVAIAVSILAALIAAVTVDAGASAGTFPGTNGRIAFTWVSGVNEDQLDIFVVNPDGSGLMRLTHSTASGSDTPSGFAYPSWSPDGTEIAYVGRTGDRFGIYTISASGGTPRTIVESDEYLSEPSWSPDGTEIAYEGSDEGGVDAEIYRIPVVGGTPTNVTNNHTGDSEPTWSPDGTRIAYVGTSSTTGTRHVLTIPITGGTPTQISRDTQYDGHPSWSPDGSKVAYDGLPAGAQGGNSYEIFTVPSAGGAPTQLTDNDTPDMFPSWSPDGTKIAYDADLNVDGHEVLRVFAMPATGGTPMKIVEGGGAPDWGPPPTPKQSLHITPSSLPTGLAGKYFPYTRLRASGGEAPYTWAIISGALPAGMRFSSRGTISGRPVNAGTYSFTVKVTDRSNPRIATAQVFSITVAPMTVTTSALPSEDAFGWYSASIKAVGGRSPRTWSLADGALPPGLKLSTAGRITGRPTAAGTFSLTVQVVDRSVPQNVATKQLSITIS